MSDDSATDVSPGEHEKELRVIELPSCSQAGGCITQGASASVGTLLIAYAYLPYGDLALW